MNDFLPTFTPAQIDAYYGANKAPTSLPNPVLAGIKAGGAGFVGGLGSAGEAAGQLFGLPTLQQGGAGLAQAAAEYSKAHGRPDLETQDWFGPKSGGVAGFLPKVGYEAGKFVAPIGAAVAGSALAGGAIAAAPEEALTAGALGVAARLGATLPEFLGGGGLTRGAAAALGAKAPELTAGALHVGGIGGAAASLYPQAVAGQYESAKQQPGGATPGDAARSLLLGGPLAVAESIVPAGGARGLFRGFAGSAAGSRIEGAIQGGIANAAAGAIGSGLQRGADVAFRPDISNIDKMKAVLDATVQGSVFGGVLGGVAGLRRENPARLVQNIDKVNKEIDNTLNIPGADLNTPAGAQTPAPPPADQRSQRLQVQELLRKMAGLKAERPTDRVDDPQAYLQKMRSRNAPEAYNEILADYRADHPVMGTAPMQKVLENFGILNKKGLERNITEEMAGLVSNREYFLKKAALPGAAGDWASRAKEVEGQIKKLEPLVALKTAADTLRAQPGAVPGAEVPPPAQPDLSRPLPPVQPDLAPPRAEISPTKPPAGVKPAAEPEAHAFARMVLGLGPDDKLPAMIAGKKVKLTDIDSLQRLVDEKLAPDGSLKKGVSPQWEKFRDALVVRGEAPEKETPNAVRQPGPEGLLPQVSTQAGGEVGIAHPAGNAPTQEVTPRQGGEATQISGPYPGDAVAAARLGLTPPNWSRYPQEAVEQIRGAYSDGVQQLWKYAREGRFGPDYDDGWQDAEFYHNRNVSRSTIVPHPGETAPASGEPPSVAAPTPLSGVFQRPAKAPGPRPLTGIPLPDTPQSRQADLDAQTALGPKPLDRLAPDERAAGFSLKGKFTQEEMEAIRRDAETRQAANIARGGSGARVEPEPERTLAQILEQRNALNNNIFDRGGAATRLYNGPPADPTFSKAMSREQFDRAFQGITAGIPRNILDRMHVLDTPSQLPAHVLRDITDQRMDPNHVYGAEKGGEIYVMRRMFNDPQKLRDIVEHEIYHKQAQEVFGERHTEMMANVFARAGDTAGALKLASKYGVEANLRAYLPVGPMDIVDKARIADELLAMVREKTAGRLTQPLMEWAGKIKQAFVSSLRDLGMSGLADHLDKFSTIDAAAFISDVRKAAAKDQGYIPDGQSARASAAMRQSIPGQDETMGTAQRFITSLRDHFDEAFTGGLPRAVVQDFNYASSRDGIARRYPEMERLPDLDQLTSQIEKRFGQPGIGITNRLREFKSNDIKGYTQLAGLVSHAIGYGGDASRSWKDNYWLQDKANAKDLAVEHAARNLEYNQLGQSGGPGQQLFKDMAALGVMHKYAGLSSVLDRVVGLFYADKDIVGFGGPGMKDYLSRNDLHDDVHGSAVFQKAIHTPKLAGALDYLQTQRAEAARIGADSPAGKKILEDVAPLSGAITEQLAAIKAGDKEPYFHAGRSGDYFVSMHAATDASGKRPDSKAIDAMQQSMEKRGFGDVAMLPLSEEGHIYMKFRSSGEARRAQAMAYEFQKAGYLDPQKNIASGLVTQANFIPDMAPKFLEQLIEKGRANRLDEDQLRDLRTLVLDTLPNTAIQKVFQKREGKQGFSTDIIANLQHRNSVGAKAVARATTQGEINEVLANARQVVQDTKSTDTSFDYKVKLQDAVDEITKRRSGNRLERAGQTFEDYARAITQRAFISMNPAYTTLQMSQIATNLWPELTKKYGAVKSAQAIASVTAAAFKATAGVARGEHASTFGITPEALAGVGISAGQKEALQWHENAGNITTGFTSSLNRPGSIASLDKVLGWAGISSMYAETVPRVIAILAAQKLSGGADRAYEHYIVNESMRRWDTANSPRAFGKQGAFGAASPLVFQFERYTGMQIEKLMYETSEALGGSKEARKFMLAHLTAATVLAGTLGLPIAGALAGAATKVSAAFNEGEGYDVQAHFRHFMRGVFGKDAEEIIDRGLPRYLGVDTARWGDADLVPFTELIEDRRKWEDSSKDYLMHAWGAPTSLMYNWVLGARDMANGQVIQGLKELLPTSLRNLAGAYQVARGVDGHYAYIDRQGREMRVPADAMDVLKTALGYTAGKLAEAREEDRTLAGAKADRQFHAKVIQGKFNRAFTQGDQDGMQSAVNEALDFDTAPEHLGQNLTGGLIAGTLKNQQETQTSKVLNVPRGAALKDLPTLELLR